MQTIQNFAEFQQAFGLEPVEVEVTPKSGSAFKCYFKPMTSRARDRFEASIAGIDGKRDLDNMRARLVAMCVCEPDGTLWFADEKEALKFGEQNAGIVSAMFDKARELNGMEAVEEAGKD